MHHQSVISLLALALLSLLSLLSAATARATHPIRSTPNNLAVKVVHQFPPGTWVENLAFRQTEHTVLVTTVRPHGQVYEVHPKTSNITLIADFPTTTSALGIVEHGKDVFYVAVGNVNFSDFSAGAGSYSVHRIGLHKNGGQTVSKLVDLPAASFLNGMCSLNTDGILVADSVLGAVWHVNVKTSAVNITIQDATMKPGTSGVGINGIKIRGKHLYYTNSGLGSLYKIPINLKDGTATGPVVLISNNVTDCDDFTIGAKGNAWVAANIVENELLFLRDVEAAGAVTGSVSASVAAGAPASTELAGITAVEFGREGTLYLTTTGGFSQYESGNFTLGGTLSSVHV